MKYCRLIFMFCLCLNSIICFAQSARTPIVFWHAMSGSLGLVVDNIVKQFNQSQRKYHVIAVYKGSYTETLTSTVAAFRAGQQPNLVQIFEVGTATMIHPKGVIVPVYRAMQEAQITFNSKDIIPALRKYYSDNENHLLAMPFNSSSAVLFYNKAKFKRAGLNPNKPPVTWPEVYAMSKKLRAAKIDCGITTTFPSWIQLETFSAWHNIAFASQDNGFKGLNALMLFNNPTVIRHISTLAKWQKQGIFQYGGRDDNAMALFTSGTCAMMMESSGSLGSLRAQLHDNLGVTEIPYWPDVKGAPQNTIIGGAAIWIMARHSKIANKGAAEFLKFLASTRIQLQWQAASGYIPITLSAYKRAKQQGYYKTHPGADVAIKSLNRHKPTRYTQGLRLGNYAQIRNINAQALESVWSGKTSAKAALDTAVKRDNVMLKRFERNTRQK